MLYVVEGMRPVIATDTSLLATVVFAKFCRATILRELGRLVVAEARKAPQ
jgi:hypothetical protein